MSLLARILAIAFVCAVWSNPVSAQDSDGLRVGQVIGHENDLVINGWTKIIGTLYQKWETQNYVTSVTWECCVAVFMRGDSYLFASTTPVAHNASGGVEAVRITSLMAAQFPSGEDLADCNLLLLVPVASFSSDAGNPIRSVFFDGERFTTIMWTDPGDFCDFGD